MFVTSGFPAKAMEEMSELPRSNNRIHLRSFIKVWTQRSQAKGRRQAKRSAGSKSAMININRLRDGCFGATRFNHEKVRPTFVGYVSFPAPVRRHGGGRSASQRGPARCPGPGAVGPNQLKLEAA